MPKRGPRRGATTNVRQAAGSSARLRRFFAPVFVGVAVVMLVLWAILGNGGDDANSSTQSSVSTARSPGDPAGVSQSAPRVGMLFPEFAVRELGGQTVTRESMKGKPSIIWFTTAYCVPCQVGAQKVAQLDDQLGGNAFNVLVLFVDPSEPPSVLRSWRQDFARPDWMVAFDSDLARRVGLRFLDSKFLLDSDGVLQNSDFATVDQRYLSVITGVVQGSR